MNDEQLLKFFKESTITEIGEHYKHLRFASVWLQDDELLQFHTCGWSDNEYFIHLLLRTKHRYNYVGSLKGGHHYFDVNNQTTDDDVEYEIIKIKTKKPICSME